jgi:hypothetical protein
LPPLKMWMGSSAVAVATSVMSTTAIEVVKIFMV